MLRWKENIYNIPSGVLDRQTIEFLQVWNPIGHMFILDIVKLLTFYSYYNHVCSSNYTFTIYTITVQCWRLVRVGPFLLL